MRNSQFFHRIDNHGTWLMVDVALIHPVGCNWIPALERSVFSANRMIPIGIMSISAYLKRRGVSTTIIDCCGHDIASERCAAAIIAQKPAYVGFSCTTSSFHDGYKIAAIVKQSLPDTKVVFGGVHVSSQRESLLADFPAIDFLVVGEGEDSFYSLVSGKRPSEILGIVYRHDSQICFSGFRKDMLDLDTLPFPDYKGLDGFPLAYNLPIFNYPKYPNSTMITSRGCPFQCLFCDRSVFRRGYRVHSAQYIYEHMRMLKTDYHIQHINIYDDLFTYDRQRILEFSELLQRKPLHMSYNCAVRFDSLNEEIVAALQASGCWMVSLGIESGDPEILKINKASADLKLITESIHLIKKHGIRVKGLFMMGLPGETEDSIQRTLKYILSLPLDDVNMSKFTPFPGAPIYRVIDRYGEMIEDWARMNCMNFIFRPRDIVSLDRLDQLYCEFITRYYERPRMLWKYITMFWRSPHSWYSLFRQMPDFLAARRYFKTTSIT